MINGQVSLTTEFLLNCVNYLLDDTGLINIRNKFISLVYLNPEKIIKNRTTYQYAIYSLAVFYLYLSLVLCTLLERKWSNNFVNKLIE